MRHNVLETIIGAVVIAFASIFFYFVYSSSSSSLDKGYVIYAQFDRVDGINVGTDIKVSGVKIGKVLGYSVDPNNYRAKVALWLKEDFFVPEDSSAEIVGEGLLGGKYVALVPGISPDHMKPGHQITETQSSVNFESMISKFLTHSGDTSSSKNNHAPHETHQKGTTSSENTQSNMNKVA